MLPDGQVTSRCIVPTKLVRKSYAEEDSYNHFGFHAARASTVPGMDVSFGFLCSNNSSREACCLCTITIGPYVEKRQSASTSETLYDHVEIVSSVDVDSL